MGNKGKGDLGRKKGWIHFECVNFEVSGKPLSERLSWRSEKWMWMSGREVAPMNYMLAPKHVILLHVMSVRLWQACAWSLHPSPLFLYAAKISPTIIVPWLHHSLTCCHYSCLSLCVPKILVSVTWWIIPQVAQLCDLYASISPTRLGALWGQKKMFPFCYVSV